jgi:hypothetical protein
MGTDKLQGCAWASQAAQNFLIPSQASLHGILKPIAYFAPQNALASGFYNLPIRDNPSHPWLKNDPF